MIITVTFRSRLCHNKQSKVYLPEPPFPHAEVSPVVSSCSGSVDHWISASLMTFGPTIQLFFQHWPCSVPGGGPGGGLVDSWCDSCVLFCFQLIQTNKLKHYPSIHGDFSSEFRQPCVVFTGHPSLRFGDVVHFMELWGKSSLNTIIFTGHSAASQQSSACTRDTVKSCHSQARRFVLSDLQSRTFLTWMLWLPTSRWL